MNSTATGLVIPADLVKDARMLTANAAHLTAIDICSGTNPDDPWHFAGFEKVMRFHDVAISLGVPGAPTSGPASVSDEQGDYLCEAAEVVLEDARERLNDVDPEPEQWIAERRYFEDQAASARRMITFISDSADARSGSEA